MVVSSIVWKKFAIFKKYAKSKKKQQIEHVCEFFPDFRGSKAKF